MRPSFGVSPGSRQARIDLPVPRMDPRLGRLHARFNKLIELIKLNCEISTSRAPSRGASEDDQTITAPPAISSTVPVIQVDISDARNKAASATSRGTPSRRKGCREIMCSRLSSGILLWFRSVIIVSGAMQLTRIPSGPACAATSRVRWIRPAFATP